jgi:hypothetical protein
VAEDVENLSPMLRIAPPPLGRLRLGNGDERRESLLEETPGSSTHPPHAKHDLGLKHATRTERDDCIPFGPSTKPDAAGVREKNVDDE